MKALAKEHDIRTNASILDIYPTSTTGLLQDNTIQV